MIEIRMEGPGKNALGTAMMTFLLDGLRAAAGEPILLTGAGDAFSAGLNLKEVAAADADGMLAFLRLLEETMSALYLYSGPIVAAVNGHAIAGGCVVTQCCDHRVMTTNERAKIGLNETALGVRLPPRLLQILRRRLPPQNHERILLGADLVSPKEALALGLVDELADDPVEAAKKRLATLGAHSKTAYAETKADLRGSSPSDLVPDAQFEATLKGALATWSSPAIKEKLLRALAR